MTCIFGICKEEKYSLSVDILQVIWVAILFNIRFLYVNCVHRVWGHEWFKGCCVLEIEDLFFCDNDHRIFGVKGLSLFLLSCLD